MGIPPRIPSFWRDAGWLVAEFTMPTESQSSAVDKIDRELRFHVENRIDSIIMFPKSEQERLRAKRKTERRRPARRGRPGSNS